MQVHPNLWIRHATVGFISAAARTLNIVDVQCKVQFMIKPYLKHPLIQIEKEILLLEALVPPIPRVVYDSVIKYSDVEELFRVFEQRQAARVKAITGIVPQYNDMSNILRNVSADILLLLLQINELKILVIFFKLSYLLRKEIGFSFSDD